MAAMVNDLPSLPEGMAELLEEIPQPPLPRDAVDRLTETADRFFATDARALPPHRTALASLNFLFGEKSPEDGVHYLGLGLRGHGLQSWNLEYLLDAKNLRLALSLPWGNAYGDPEGERANAEAAFRLAHLCMAYRPADAFLTLFLSDDTLFWSLTREDATLKEGGSINGLLDALQAPYEDINSRNWLPV